MTELRDQMRRDAEALRSTHRNGEAGMDRVEAFERLFKQLPQLVDDLEATEAKVTEYENAITWETSCLACSATLDSSIKEHERAERAEAAIQRVKVAVALMRYGIENRQPSDERDLGRESACEVIDDALCQPSTGQRCITVDRDTLVDILSRCRVERVTPVDGEVKISAESFADAIMTAALGQPPAEKATQVPSPRPGGRAKSPEWAEAMIERWAPGDTDA